VSGARSASSGLLPRLTSAATDPVCEKGSVCRGRLRSGRASLGGGVALLVEVDGTGHWRRDGQRQNQGFDRLDRRRAQISDLNRLCHALKYAPAVGSAAVGAACKEWGRSRPRARRKDVSRRCWQPVAYPHGVPRVSKLFRLPGVGPLHGTRYRFSDRWIGLGVGAFGRGLDPHRAPRAQWPRFGTTIAETCMLRVEGPATCAYPHLFRASSSILICW